MGAAQGIEADGHRSPGTDASAIVQEVSTTVNAKARACRAGQALRVLARDFTWRISVRSPRRSSYAATP